MSRQGPTRPSPEETGPEPDPSEETRPTSGGAAGHTTQNWDTGDTRSTQPKTPEVTAASLIGKTLGGCFLESLIGRGAIGQVYRSRQLSMGGRIVAVKVIPDTVDREQVERFQREARAASRLKTDYVAEVYHAGYEDGWHYLIEEYVDGGTLADYRKSLPDQRVPVPELLRFLKQAAAGLLEAEQHVNENGEPAPIIHRDIKPHNLLLKRVIEDGEEKRDVRIVDFGAAKIQGIDATFTGMGAPMTPAFASPEQWELKPVDSRTDMYCLGSTFYTLATGKRAVPSQETRDIKLFTLQEPWLDPRIANDGLPESFAEVIMKMTQNLKEDRYQSFGDLLQHVEKIEQGINPKIKHRNRTIQSLKKRLLLYQIGTVAVLLTVIGLLLFTGKKDPANAQPRETGIVLRDAEAKLAKSLEDARVEAFRAAVVPKPLAGLHGEVERVLGEISTVLAWAKKERAGGKQRSELPAGAPTPENAADDLERLLAKWSHGTWVAGEISATEKVLDTTRGDKLKERLGNIRTRILRQDLEQELAVEVSALAGKIDDLVDARTKTLRPSLQKVATGLATVTALNEVDRAVALHEERMRRAGETELEGNAGALRRAVAHAKKLEAALAANHEPAWTKLDDLNRALGEIVRSYSLPGEMDAQWARAQSSYSEWRGRRLQAFGRSWQAAIDEGIAEVRSLRDFAAKAIGKAAGLNSQRGKKQEWEQALLAAKQAAGEWHRQAEPLRALIAFLQDPVNQEAARAVFRWQFTLELAAVTAALETPGEEWIPPPEILPRPVPKPPAYPRAWKGRQEWIDLWEQVAAGYDPPPALLLSPGTKLGSNGATPPLWRFQGRDVDMVAAGEDTVFLADVHPVTVQEFDSRLRDMPFGPCQQNRRRRNAKINDAVAKAGETSLVLMFSTTTKSAEAFATTAYQRKDPPLKFALPTKAQLAEVMSRTASLLQKPFWNKGRICEWAFAETDIVKVGGDGDAGFRLVFNLRKR